MESTILRRALVGLAIFATTVALGVVLAAGGDQAARRAPAGHLTAVGALSGGRSRRHAANVVTPRPGLRMHKPRPAGRSNPL